MVIPSAGSVVVIPFPFSDLSKSKLRPALVLANVGKGDWILSQITSKSYADKGAIALNREDFSSGSLKIASFIRPGKLFTANKMLFHGHPGSISSEKLKEVIITVIDLLNEAIA